MNLLHLITRLRSNVARKGPALTSGPVLPPGQVAIEKWPVFTAGATPKIDISTWKLALTGLVENSIELSHQEILSLPKKTVQANFHCVTGWSRLDNSWEGVGVRELVEQAKPRLEARYVLVHCYGGYTTNLPLGILLDHDTLLAFLHNGKELTPEHGWPLRLVIPKRYAWKSAKWVRELEFMDEEEPGFWEIRGHHNDGDPWKEERVLSSLSLSPSGLEVYPLTWFPSVNSG